MDKHCIESPALSLRRYGAVSACDIHAFHQIVLGVDGAMDMLVDGVGQRIDASHAWLIPAGARHEYAGIGENRQLILDVPCSSLALPERIFSRAVALVMNDSLAGIVREVSSCAAGIETAVQAGASRAAELDGTAHARNRSYVAAPAERAHRLAWHTAARIARLLGDHLGAPSPSTKLDYTRIDNWLRAHLSEPLRIIDLAAHCGFGERRFHQLFAEAFGTTPHRYLQRLRLDTALILLGDSYRTLSDVALTVGFGDQSAFTHAFTRRFGIAPGQWRAAQIH